VKKLIGIGVALAILAIVVLPVSAAAQSCNYTYGTDPAVTVEPVSYAKIPFAILESGLGMLSNVLAALPSDLGLPAWLPDIVLAIAPWTGGPLSWTVDMLGWGVTLVGDVLTAIAVPLGLPVWLDDLVFTISCGLFQPFNCEVSGPDFDPCRP